MSGHSRWAQIKHRKAAVDAKRGKLFSKLIKEIAASARIGGGDPELNPRLRTAVIAAKSANVKNDLIENAIQRGAGGLDGVNDEEIAYEGYGPSGVALMVEVMTDNRNRTVADLRHALSKNGGSMGENGCVAWLFDKRGMIVVEKESIDEDEFFMVAVEAGVEDVIASEDTIEVLTPFEEFDRIRTAVEEFGATVLISELTMIPQTTVKLEGAEAQQMLRLMEALEDLDDVQKVYANFDIPDEILEEAA